MYNYKRFCDCPNISENAKSMNALGRNRYFRVLIQRQGYDRVNVGLIEKLLEDPNGSYFTDVFDNKLPFSREMRVIRQKIMRIRLHDLLKIENPMNIRCNAMRKIIEENELDPEEFLDYLKINF